MSILSIDTSLWPSSGAATEITTRGGAASGIVGLDGNWTHGIDSQGRRYIEHANGAEDIIDLIDAASIFGTTGDRVRFQYGLMLVQNNPLSYAALSGIEERFFDTSTGERVIMLLRHGTDFFDGEAFRFNATEFGPSAVITEYSTVSGFEFDTLYEIAFEGLFDDPGWIRTYVDGIQINAVDADMTGANMDRIARMKIVDVPNDDLRYRIYGDRNGFIGVIDDDFDHIPLYERESSSPFSFRFMDLQPSSASDNRGFWSWDNVENVTTDGYATGGSRPNRQRAIVNSSGATATLNYNFESKYADKRDVVVIDGIKINPGGSFSVVFSTDGEELGRIIFDSNVVQIKHGSNDAQNILTYQDDVWYCLRLNRYNNELRVSIEDLSNDFESSPTLFVASFQITNQAPFSTSHFKNISLICNDCEVDGIMGMDHEWTAIVSSYTASDVASLTPAKVIYNRLWANFPKAFSYRAFPGALASLENLNTGWAFTTLGRSGNEITDFVQYNGFDLQALAGQTILCLEWIVNDLSPVRLSEGATIAARDLILERMEELIDYCIEYDINLWVGRPVPPPIGGSPQNWSSFTIDAYLYLDVAVKSLLESKRRPDLLRWAEVDNTTASYFTGGVDDVHFNGAGDALYYQRFMTEIAPIGIARKSIAAGSSPRSVPAPTFSIDSDSPPTRIIDANMESVIRQQTLESPVTVQFEEVSSGFEIRYTTNNRTPTRKSQLYTNPIVLTRNLTGSDNTVIKARVFSINDASLKSRIMRVDIRI